MEKKLSITLNPTMDCFNFESFLHNILSTNQFHSDWIRENYINIFMKKNWQFEKHNHLYSITPQIENIPGLQVNKIRRDFFFHQNLNIINVLQQALKDNYYVYLYLDEYYLNNSISYQKFHFTHDSLITGFNDDNFFYLFAYDKTGKLTNRKITSDEITHAFKELDNVYQFDSDIFLYRPIKHYYKHNLDTIKNNLNDYLNGTNTLYIDIKNYHEDFIYGIKTYQILYNVYLNEKINIDIRIPHKILEHKKIISELVLYLQTRGIIDSPLLLSDIKVIENLAQVIKLNTIKFNYAKINKLKIKEKILKLLIEIECKEQEFIQRLIIAINQKI
jgi:hypothetical protein